MYEILLSQLRALGRCTCVKIQWLSKYYYAFCLVCINKGSVNKTSILLK